MFNKLLKGFAVLAALFLVLVGPTAYFWIQWMMPGNGLPAATDARFSHQVAANSELVADLERILVEHHSQSGAPSFSAAISRDGELLWAGASGFAELESPVPATSNFVYRLGSVSKALTGTLLGRLADAGLIDLDARVADLAPELPHDLHAITVRQLASHTGGIRHYSRMPTWLPAHHESITAQHYESVEDGLALFIDDDLLFPPGSDFNYSTFGYSLLSYLMERATRLDFATLVNQYLNAALSTDLRLDELNVDMPDRATTYTTAKGRWGPAYPADPSYKWAGGGIVATPSDLVWIGQALLGDTFISMPIRAGMWSPVPITGSNTNPQNYGIGWRVDLSTRTLGEDQPLQMIHHGGTQMGGVAFWAIYPELGISVAVASNTGERAVRGDVQDAAYALVRAVVTAADDQTLGR